MESWVIGYEGDQDVERHSGAGGLEPSKPLRALIISDYICPWCYIGLTRVERLKEEFPVEIEVCPFELRPGLPPEGLPRELAYAGRTYPPGYIDNILRLAQESGINMKRPARVPNTWKAHEATEYAREHGRLGEFHRRVFQAYWEDEEDIGDPAVLCRLGEECGLDADGLRQALAEGRYTPQVRRQMEWARQAAAHGVPTVVFNDRFTIVGAQDYAVFRDVAARILSGKLKADE